MKMAAIFPSMGIQNPKGFGENGTIKTLEKIDKKPLSCFMETVMLKIPKNSLDYLMYESFAKAFDARLLAEQVHCLDARELKDIEDKLWRLFIRQAYRNSKDYLPKKAA